MIKWNPNTAANRCGLFEFLTWSTVSRCMMLWRTRLLVSFVHVCVLSLRRRFFFIPIITTVQFHICRRVRDIFFVIKEVLVVVLSFVRPCISRRNQRVSFRTMPCVIYVQEHILSKSFSRSWSYVINGLSIDIRSTETSKNSQLRNLLRSR